MNNGLRVPLRENDKVVARIFGGQKAFGFSSTVQRVCKIPYDYLHLTFPDHIQGSVIRKSPRVKTKIITSIALLNSGDGDKKSGIIVNLSADGAMVRTRQPLVEKGEAIQMSFRINLHNLDAYLTVNAIVRSIFNDESEEARNDPMISHGVQFQDVPPNDTVILQSLIYQQMIEQPHTLA
jgi:c-di-GMP-binding flagellar brake protein YcgR